ncbi:MAG: hypothetical protein EAX86_03555 [Candidatus Heimdallarchaeota archaeon]|nr:hypothetical protein [Candidatus Heimdallarchaeota archaeon]
MSQKSDPITKHKFFIFTLIIIYILSAITVTTTPKGFEIPILEQSFVLFGPSISAFILIFSIGGYLCYRYFAKSPPRSAAKYQLIWGISFLLYGITFIGLCLQALAFDLANMNNPALFFIWRNPMIFWVAGMIIGTMMLLTNNKKLIYLPGFLIFLIGEGWFTWRLLWVLDQNSIEQTMYGFLFWFFIPICVIIAYLFYNYSKDLDLSSARLLTLGFSLLALTYAAWAPWHFQEPNLTYIYFICFNLFLVSLAFIFAGFFALPKETAAKVISK